MESPVTEFSMHVIEQGDRVKQRWRYSKPLLWQEGACRRGGSEEEPERLRRVQCAEMGMEIRLCFLAMRCKWGGPGCGKKAAKECTAGHGVILIQNACRTARAEARRQLQVLKYNETRAGSVGAKQGGPALQQGVPPAWRFHHGQWLGRQAGAGQKTIGFEMRRKGSSEYTGGAKCGAHA